MAKKKKYYVVWLGNNPGIYESWTDTQLQIKGFPGAKYKAFSNRQEAEEAFSGTYDEYHKKSVGSSKKPVALSQEARKEIIWDSIAVDAACSGNPGVMEYQGVETKSRLQLFHQKFGLGTNNIGEFLAIVHALAMFKKQKKATPIYTDSKIAMGWVKRKHCKTNLKRTAKTAKLHAVIARAEKWLKENTYDNPILKWETEKWGEIPADFGRK